MGDVYLMMKSGDVKRGAGLTILLYRVDSLLPQEVRQICGGYQARIRAIPETYAALKARIDSARLSVDRSVNVSEADRQSYYALANSLAPFIRRADAAAAEEERQMSASIRAVWAKRLIDTVGTGLNAGYRFTGLPAGDYQLRTAWRIGDNDYTWFVSATLAPRQQRKLDLDAANEGSRMTYCETPKIP